MTPNAPGKQTKSSVHIPRARIHAQNTVFATPLREYFLQYGCDVVINVDSDEEYTYIICVGDSDFVKRFFEKNYTHGAKKLGIFYEGLESDLNVAHMESVKSIFIDPVPPSKDTLRDIFSFFFIESRRSKDTRKGPKYSKKSEVTPPVPTHEAGLDRVRIAQLLKQNYERGISSKNIYNQRFIWIVSRLVTVGIFGFIIPSLIYTVSLVLSVVFVFLSSKMLIDGNTALSKSLLQYADTQVRVARSLQQIGSPLASLAGLGRIMEDQERIVSIIADAAHVEASAIELFEESSLVTQAIFVPTASTIGGGVADVNKLKVELSLVARHLGLIQSQLDLLNRSDRFPFQIDSIKKLSSRAQGNLAQVRDIVGYAEQLLTLYPHMGGFRRKQTYLVLLQNSMELRPTGGFIGSMILLSFQDGKVESMEVQDVYTADGQLKGHVDPPIPIREIMGQEHWYLRDSNWDPDFAISGAQAAWFYEKELGVSVDGVIAISLPAVTKLLEVTGPIELVDFNDRISAGNFFTKSLFYTQNDFFPGSTQKKDFLGALTSAMLSKLTTDYALSPAQLLESVSDAISAKDIQFYFPDQKLATLIAQWKWDGGVNIGQNCQPLLEGASCISDGIGIVSANLGINKSNYFVKQEALSQISIRADGTIDHSLSLKTINESPLDAPGGGAYINYMRLLMPKGTDVGDVYLDGNEVATRSVVPGEAQPEAPYKFVEDTQTGTVLHILYTVIPQQESELKIKTLRHELALSQGTTEYNLILRKQPGVETLPWQVDISYPPSWSWVSDAMLANDSALRYNTDLTKDKHIRIVFGQLL